MPHNDNDRSTTHADDDAARPENEDRGGRAVPDRESRDVQNEDPGPLQNEYDGKAGRDGIPANGTRPVDPQGPEDFGGNAWGEGV